MRWRTGNKVKLNVYEEDRPVCQCHDERDAERIVISVNRMYGGEPSPKFDLEKNMARLTNTYGTPRVDYFVGGVWRLWWPAWHVHLSVGATGDLSAQGGTLEEVISRIDKIATERTVRQGSCRKGCPEYSDCV